MTGYRAVLAASAGVVCNSHHEIALLREGGMLAADDLDPSVVPLPMVGPAIEPPKATMPLPSTRHEVAILGFVYPGKGHAEAIRATSQLDPAPAVRALGQASHGHEADLAVLQTLARDLGVEFTVTGWLPDAELTRACRAAAIGLAAHTHLSASGSINSWIGAGRRPLVADSRYAREIDRLRPGTVCRYPAGELTGALRAALEDPVGTWLSRSAVRAPTLTDTARSYLDFWARR